MDHKKKNHTNKYVSGIRLSNSVLGEAKRRSKCEEHGSKPGISQWQSSSMSQTKGKAAPSAQSMIRFSCLLPPPPPPAPRTPEHKRPGGCRAKEENKTHTPQKTKQKQTKSGDGAKPEMWSPGALPAAPGPLTNPWILFGTGCRAAPLTALLSARTEEASLSRSLCLPH